MTVDILENPKIQLYLFHLILVPTIIYFILFKPNKLIYRLTILLGILIILYHFYKLWNNYKIGFVSYVNLLHILVIGPLILMIGIMEKNIPLVIKDFTLILMIGSIVIFSKKIIQTYSYLKN
jgi:hypothetical protein